MTIDPLTLATVVATWVLVAGTLAFAYWQLRQAQRLHSSTTLLELRERFYSPRFRQARRSLSRWLISDPRNGEPDDWEVGIFFELLGAQTRSGVLDRRMVWKAFGSWVTAYYTFLVQPVDLLARWREEAHDPDIFGDFQWLAVEMFRFDARSSRSGAPPYVETEDARSILETEATLRSSAAPSDGAG